MASEKVKSETIRPCTSNFLVGNLVGFVIINIFFFGSTFYMITNYDSDVDITFLFGKK